MEIGGDYFFNTPPETVKDFFYGIINISSERLWYDAYHYNYNSVNNIIVDLKTKEAYISPKISKILLSLYKS